MWRGDKGELCHLIHFANYAHRPAVARLPICRELSAPPSDVTIADAVRFAPLTARVLRLETNVSSVWPFCPSDLRVSTLSHGDVKSRRAPLADQRQAFLQTLSSWSLVAVVTIPYQVLPCPTSASSSSVGLQSRSLSAPFAVRRNPFHSHRRSSCPLQSPRIRRHRIRHISRFAIR